MGSPITRYVAEKEINKVVQQLMGHAHYSTTMDIYTHVTEDTLEKEMDKFKEAMNA